MSYTDESVKAKLSTLNDTQESIVTVAQWVMFHRNHAPQTAQIWLQRLKDSGTTKRLHLVYLANEVVQQSKARKRHDFLTAFSPIIAEAAAIAYGSAPTNVQHKLRRVIDVWRGREIFSPDIQRGVESRINDIDKTQSVQKSVLVNGASQDRRRSGADMPSELLRISQLQASLSEAQVAATSEMQSAQADFNKLDSSTAAPPAPPVHAARLTSLLRSLSSTHTAVSGSLAARKKVLDSLQDLVAEHQAALHKDEESLNDLRAKRRVTEAKKIQVEDAIMRGLSSEEAAAAAANVEISEANGANTISSGANTEPLRPDVEPLSPPVYESFTPPHEKQLLPDGAISTGMTDESPLSINGSGSHTPSGLPGVLDPQSDHSKPAPHTPALETSEQPSDPTYTLSSTSTTLQHEQQPLPQQDPRRIRKAESDVAATTTTKRRKTSENYGDDFGGFAIDGDAMEGLDEDVVGMLG